MDKVTIPVNTMLFRAEGPRVAVVGADGKVVLRPITHRPGLRHHPGDPSAACRPPDRIIVNPSDSLEDGQQVEVARPAAGEARGTIN